MSTSTSHPIGTAEIGEIRATIRHLDTLEPRDRPQPGFASVAFASMSGLYVAGLSIVSVLVFATLPVFYDAWTGARPFPLPLSHRLLKAPLEVRLQAGPSLLICAYLLCLSGWGFLVSAMVGKILLLVWLASLVMTVTIIRGGRPSFLVPPSLRRS
jgi:hypothetical protein